MDTAKTIEELDNSLSPFRENRERLAFVPTMGALHEGHLGLVAFAKTLGHRTVVSIFVNPTQFDRADDLAAYPRQVAEDEALLRAADVDVLFLPTDDSIYPPDYVRPAAPDLLGLDTRFEGARRPGHFDGVVEVVRRLVQAVRPDVMVMGRKDAQQLAILRRASAVEAWPVEIVGVDTVRAESGLALSSRNAQLSEEALATAPQLHAALVGTAEAAVAGEPAGAAAAASRRVLAEAGFEVEYLEVVRARDFEGVDEVREGEEALVILAAWLDGVRLIDNVSAV